MSRCQPVERPRREAVPMVYAAPALLREVSRRRSGNIQSSRQASLSQTRSPSIARIGMAQWSGTRARDADQPARANDELRREVEEIAAECERRGLRLLEVVRERELRHRRRPLERPGLAYALEQIAAGNASGLVVSDLSRLSHSLPDLGRVLEWLAGRDARFVAAGPGLDTEEEAGRLALRAIIEVSRWERERLVERTRNGMREARRKGPASVADDPELSERIARMRAAGATLQAIADDLNTEGIPTVRGGASGAPRVCKPPPATGARPPATRSTYGLTTGSIRTGRSRTYSRHTGSARRAAAARGYFPPRLRMGSKA